MRLVEFDLLIKQYSKFYGNDIGSWNAAVQKDVKGIAKYRVFLSCYPMPLSGLGLTGRRAERAPYPGKTTKAEFPSLLQISKFTKYLRGQRHDLQYFSSNYLRYPQITKKLSPSWWLENILRESF